MSNELEPPRAGARWWPYQEALVYRRMVTAGNPRAVEAPGGLSLVWLTESSIARLFGDNPALHRRFMRFRRNGAMGVAIAHGRRVLSYAWMATPEGRQPLHLPAAMAGRYWIFECHTVVSMRGRGLIACALSRLLGEIAERQDGPCEVYCDVAPANMPSRRAFLRLGFEPAGRSATWRVPKSSIVMGTWDATATHLAMPTVYPKSG
jgi:hypothetical protein